MLMESELVEDQLPLMVVMQEFQLLLLVISTAKLVGGLLDTRLEVQMPLVFCHFINHLIPTTSDSMESTSLTEHFVTTSGPTLLEYQKGGIDINKTTVHAVILIILIMHTLHHLLEMTTTVNQAIQLKHLSIITFTLKINSGMATSVKVCVAAMENLLHGSV